MSYENAVLAATILGVVSAVAAFAFVMLLFMKSGIVDGTRRVVRRAGEAVRSHRGLFDYASTNTYLVSHGAGYHLWKGVTPFSYMAARMFCALASMAACFTLHPILGLPGLVFGFYLPRMVVDHGNKTDNDRMMDQIQTLYTSIRVQVMSGVNVTDALAESYRYFDRGRLHDALVDFSTGLYMRGSFDESLREFNGKFDNMMIDSLCVILQQAQLSGHAMDLLRDVSRQIDGVRNAMQLKKKERLDRTVTFCLLGLMCAIFGIVIYACVLQMYDLSGALML